MQEYLEDNTIRGPRVVGSFEEYKEILHELSAVSQFIGGRIYGDELPTVVELNRGCDKRGGNDGDGLPKRFSDISDEELYQHSSRENNDISALVGAGSSSSDDSSQDNIELSHDAVSILIKDAMEGESSSSEPFDIHDALY